MTGVLDGKSIPLKLTGYGKTGFAIKSVTVG
jgi:hypothetical protein